MVAVQHARVGDESEERNGFNFVKFPPLNEAHCSVGKLQVATKWKRER